MKKTNVEEKDKEKGKTDADIMCDNTLLPVIQKACLPHCQFLIQ